MTRRKHTLWSDTFVMIDDMQKHTGFYFPIRYCLPNCYFPNSQRWFKDKIKDSTKQAHISD